MGDDAMGAVSASGEQHSTEPVLPGLTRRAFLRTSGVVAAGITFAAAGGELAFAGDAPQSSVGWRALATQLDGALIRPGNASYPMNSRVWNAVYDKVRPGGIAMCRNANDVRKSILWARDNGVRLAVRSGGHNFAGFSTTRGLVIDVSQLNRVAVDRRAGTAVVGAGVRNQQLYPALRQYNMIVPGGVCPTVSVSGLVLGGGIGMNTRTYGLTCDNLVETKIITADGRLLTCNARENRDLFWALRGGAGGNFGVNTEFTFKTTVVGNVATYNCQFRWSDAREAFKALQELTANAPNTLNLRAILAKPGGGANPENNTPTFVSIGLYYGPESELRDMLAPVFAAATPITAQITTMSLEQAQTLSTINEKSGPFDNRADIAAKPLSDAGIDTMVTWITNRPPCSNPQGGGLSFFPLGGVANQVPARATAFVHRNSFAVMQYENWWALNDPPSVAIAEMRWGANFYEAMRPYVSGYTYQNFPFRTLRDYPHSYYGSNLHRLIRVKRKYDPHNVFRFAQSIPAK